MFSAVDFIAQIINFVILMVVLTRILYRPVTEYLDKRRKELIRTKDQAQALLHHARKQSELVDARMKQIGEISRQLLDEASREAARIREEQLKQAKAEAQEMVRHAEEEIDRKTQEAWTGLRNRVVDLVIAASEHVLRREITRADHEKILKEAVKELNDFGGETR